MTTPIGVDGTSQIVALPDSACNWGIKDDGTYEAGYVVSIPVFCDSGYVILNAGYVTDSAFCDFGDTFNVIWSPDVDGTYRETSTQPGQFFYNLFFTPEDVGNGNDSFETDETVELIIPYPFVTQTVNGNPVHAYTGLTVEEHNGVNCFVPADDGVAYPLSFTLGDYTDTNGDGTLSWPEHKAHKAKLEAAKAKSGG